MLAQEKTPAQVTEDRNPTQGLHPTQRWNTSTQDRVVSNEYSDGATKPVGDSSTPVQRGSYTNLNGQERIRPATYTQIEPPVPAQSVEGENLYSDIDQLRL